MALARKLTSKIYEIQAHAQKVTCLDVGETGRVLVTGGQDRNVNLWAFGNDKCFMSLSSHNGQIDCVKFAYNDDFVYSADENGIIKRWDLNAQPGCTTFYGHMKSVRTLDFHPYGEYVASGSNDTTVRLWDVRKNNTCIEKYRGHIANVNSVKFSPDGSWIASAGTEGSVIVWDIRMRKKIIEFQEHASPVTCIQFHPFEFLLAAGRNDGTVDLYDLERKQLISRTGSTSPFNGHTVKCVTFSENGECVFVGTAEGISVIGWEPDREFDHIESTWSILGDMKVVNNKLFCGSYEGLNVEIYAVNIDQVIPFYNPSNTPFNYNQSSRKSFSRGNQKLRLSIGSTSKSKQITSETNANVSTANEEPISPENLTFEMINEESEEPGLAFETITNKRESYLFDSIPDSNYKFLNFGDSGTSSLKLTGESDIFIDNYTSDLDYYPMHSSPRSSNVVEPEREDFPVNNAQLPDYAPKLDHLLKSQSVKTKSNFQIQRRDSPPINSVRPLTHPHQRKLSNITSVSTVDLQKIDDSMSVKKTQTCGGSPTRNYPSQITKIKKNDISVHLKKDSNHLRKTRNITVQIMAPPLKPPPRSKTSIDLRESSGGSIPVSPSSTQKTIMFPGSIVSNEESTDINTLTVYHKTVYQELTNRHAMLQLIRNSTRSHDINGALKQAIKMNDRSVLVDLLGAILEKTSSWNLDMCLILLPEVYELVQSQHKFHCTRACDTLRIILSNFLPIIQDNISLWGGGPSRSSFGVDLSREERQNKCIECRSWLLRIKMLPECNHIGSSFAQLQNLIVGL